MGPCPNAKSEGVWILLEYPFSSTKNGSWGWGDYVIPPRSWLRWYRDVRAGPSAESQISLVMAKLCDCQIRLWKQAQVWIPTLKMVVLWVSYLTSLWISFFTCKMNDVIVQGHKKHPRSMLLVVINAYMENLLFSLSVVSYSLWPHGLQHARLPCPSPSPGACSNSWPLSQWCHPTILSSIIPFSSFLQPFSASGYFPVSWLFSLGGQSIGTSASASVLPMNIQGSFF